MFYMSWLTDIRSRWGPVATPVLIAGLALAAVSLIMTLAAHINYLVAEPGVAQAHADVWGTLAIVMATASVGLLVLARTRAGDQQQLWGQTTDLAVATGLSALSIVFALIILIVGLDERVDAANSWLNFALAWSFVTLGWLVVSRPVPREWDTQRGAVIGGTILAVTAVFAVVGLSTGLGSEFDDYVHGASWLGLAWVGAIVGIGWLFGLRPSEKPS